MSAVQFYIMNGGAENAGPENDRPSQGWKIQDWTMTDQIAGTGKCRTAK